MNILVKNRLLLKTITDKLLLEIKNSNDMKYIAACAHVLLVNQNYYNNLLARMEK